MMKYLKLAVCSLVLFGAASLSARSRCNDNSCNETTSSCEPEKVPCCRKTVTYTVPAKKVCENIKVCRFVCPDTGAEMNENGEPVGVRTSKEGEKAATEWFGTESKVRNNGNGRRGRGY